MRPPFDAAAYVGIAAQYALVLAEVRRRDPDGRWSWTWVELAGAAATFPKRRRR